MSWAFALLVVFLAIGLLKSRPDGKAVAGALVATLAALAYAYHSLGG
ncbi:MAG: hypothetical protein ACRENM_04110 [Candidatus Dormibacteraceae bacterium]